MSCIKTIAETILNQLGGNKFLAMTGAKNIMATEKGLTFKLPARFAKNKINFVTVDYDASHDLYDICFNNFRGLNVKTVSSFSGIYGNKLKGLFSEETGLDTNI